LRPLPKLLAMQVKLLDLVEQYRPLREEIRTAIDALCDEQDLILGQRVESFERALADYCGTKEAIGVSSGSDALLCALMAIDIKPGDEVIVPSFTFFATAGAVARLGARPVFAEIIPETFNIDPADIAKKITSRTRAIIPVHLFGQMADMEAIEQLARKHDLLIIEDAAQAIGATRNGRTAGSIGLAGCLSFYPTKNLGAFGDAGAICCSDDEFARRCRKLRVHGSGHTYDHEMLGGMFRMAAIQAAVLGVKLPYLNDWLSDRRRHAAIYDQLFSGTPVKPPLVDRGNQHTYHQYVVRVPRRDAARQWLAKQGIATGVYYPLPLHLQKCFDYLDCKTGDLPASEQAASEVLALPIYPQLKPDQVKYVAQQLLEFVNREGGTGHGDSKDQGGF
jgi:dTDP-4-amino-4,6-dideoxygalactose transaminase